MISQQRKRIRLSLLVTAVATLSVFAYVVPASNVIRPSSVDRATSQDPVGMTSSTTIRRWGEGLSDRAVESGGIEKDLDGNASALIPSDQQLP